MRTSICAVLIAAMACTAPACAAEELYAVTIQDHRFSPEEIRVPSGKKVKLVIENLDATPEEFESYDLNREKVIAAKSKGVVFIGPLKPGRYSFFGEFNSNTAQGAVVVE